MSFLGIAASFLAENSPKTIKMEKKLLFLTVFIEKIG